MKLFDPSGLTPEQAALGLEASAALKRFLRSFSPEDIKKLLGRIPMMEQVAVKYLLPWAQKD